MECNFKVWRHQLATEVTGPNSTGLFAVVIFKGTGLCYQITKCPRAKGTHYCNSEGNQSSLLERVMGDFVRRLHECVHRQDGHLNDIIFKK
jgi:hypothetical protein